MLKKILKCCFDLNIRRSESNETLLDNNILNYNLSKLLGEGKFGSVYLGINKITNRNYAIKKSIKINYLFSNELKFLRRLNHRSIIKLEDSFIYEGHHYLVLEYCRDGDMFSYIKKYHDFDDNKTRRIILNILRPLLFLKQYRSIQIYFHIIFL